MQLKLPDKIIEFLKTEPEKKSTAREIAECIMETYPDECKEKQKQSKATKVPLDNETAFLQQLIAEIGACRLPIQKKEPKIKTTEGRPRKYYYTTRSDIDEVSDTDDDENSTSQSTLSEKDLYPILVTYLKAEYNLHAKRIDEKKSKNERGKNGNEWLYPDLVALENLVDGWSVEMQKYIKVHGEKKAKLWSFEVKKLINRSNVRRVFFQTVSNSSWANFGYLVATELAEDAKKELRMLSSLHGIGFILLDTENPSESQIIIPAKERDNLDWESINRLREANKDFSAYMENIHDFYLTGKIKEQDWDQPIASSLLE